MPTATSSDSLAKQRSAALADGNAVRRRRAELKRDLRNHPDASGADLGPLLLDPPGYLARARIIDVLSWLPGVKAHRAELILEHAGVTGGLRTVEELTQRQRTAIAERINDPQPINVKRTHPKPPRISAPVLDDISL